MKLAEPIDYESKDIYLVSGSQEGVLQNCLKHWHDAYYIRKRGERINYEPFDYGTFAHTIMQYSTTIKNKYARDVFVADYINNHGDITLRKRKQLQRSISNVIKNLDKYTYHKPSAEIKFAIKAPDEWFPPELKGALQDIKLQSGEIRSFSGIGFRGIVDYYGIDVFTKEKCIVDWKTGNYKDRWGNTTDFIDLYEEQLYGYHYLMLCHGYKPDIARTEFIITGDTHQVRLDVSLSATVIKNKLFNIAMALINAKNKEDFPTTPSEKGCSICYVQNDCIEFRDDFLYNFFVGAYS